MFNSKVGSHSRNRHLLFESLEARRVLDAVSVDTSDDVDDAPTGTITIAQLMGNKGTDGKISLREAIRAANGTPGADEITFDSTLTGDTITLTQGEMYLYDGVTIDATNRDITIDANDPTPNDGNGDGSRVFRINDFFDGDFEFIGLTIQGGDPRFEGGGIQSVDANLTLRNTTITGNKGGNGAGLSFDGDGKNLTIISSEISNNSLGYSGNRGGGVSITGTDSSIVIQDSTISENSIVLVQNLGFGGGIFIEIDALSSSVNISDTTFSKNKALNIEFGLGANTGGMHLDVTDGTVILDRLQVLDNETDDDAGGLFLINRGGEIRLRDSTITGNIARDNDSQDHGGGGLIIDTRDGGETIVENSTIASNKAIDSSGGGIFIEGSSGTTTTIVNTTISGNLAGRDGGGIMIGSSIGIPEGGSVNISHTTITDNSADWDENTSGTGGGIHQGNISTPMTLDNTIVSGNRVWDSADMDFVPNNVDGSLEATSEFNLFGSNDGSFSGLPGTGSPLFNIHSDDADLGPLMDNGGPTHTHAPLLGSPVIDAGDPSLVAGVGSTPEFDQRGGTPGGVGFDRVQDYNGTGDKIDIGAVELRPDSLIPPRITDVKISSSSPNATHGTFSFATVDGSGTQLDTVPIGGADTIEIVFDEFVNVVEGDLTLIGLSTANEPDPVSGAFVAPTINSPIAKWTFQSWALCDNYAISLDADAITDSDGNLLDGEWVNPKSTIAEDPFGLVSTFPSGDLLPGGDFNFIARILPGDANLDGEVDLLDFSILSTWLNGPTMGLLFQNADFNGDGDVTLNDFSLLSTNFNANLQTILFAADINNDGTVSQSEVDDVSTNIGTSNLIYDLDNDGDVDAFDLAFAQLSFDIDIKLVA